MPKSVLLADTDLEDLFYLRFAERGLMQYDLIGHEPQGQGPIIIAIDESSSVSRLIIYGWRGRFAPLRRHGKRQLLRVIPGAWATCRRLIARL